MKRRKACSFDPSHVYYAPLNECPWCRIEDAGGPSFFVSVRRDDHHLGRSADALDDRIRDLREVPFPELPVEAARSCRRCP